MGHRTVKRKYSPPAILAGLAFLTFIASLLGGFPPNWVEQGYSTTVFPMISHSSSVVADAVPFSWLDVAIVAGLAVIIYSVRYRRWAFLVGVVSAAYLWFFWSWGLNYHRAPLGQKLQLQTTSITPMEVDDFIKTAASELNQLLPVASRGSMDPATIAGIAAIRVERVVSRIDGKNWVAASRVKRSLIAEGWFRIAGISGMFNPFGHEPVVTSGLLDVELPFVMAHELAHVRGIPNEGDANLVALFATLASDNPAFQYSGWLHLWLYLRNAERDNLLESGPKADLKAIYERMRSQEVRWASNLQSTVLDLHLKANDIPEGIASYSRFVSLAIASQDRWDEYR